MKHRFLRAFWCILFPLSVCQLYGQCSITSSNGYTVTFTFTQNAVNLTDYGGGSSCGYTVELGYTIQYSGPNQPGNLYSVNGTLNCSPLENSGFSLGNGAPGSGTVTTYNATYYGPCEDLVLDCPITLDVGGPGIPFQTISGCGTVVYPIPSIDLLLPVEFSSFAGKLTGKEILLKWSTASEHNNKGFTVEKSITGKSWERTGWVDGAGISSSTQHYNFTDKNPLPGINYYRLKQEDFNADFEFSNIIGVSNPNENESGILIYPNPAHHTLSFICPKDQSVTEATFLNQFGQKTVLMPSDNNFDITSLHNGIYSVLFKMEDQLIDKQRIIVQ